MATALLQVSGLWNASVPQGGSRGMRNSLAPQIAQLCLLVDTVPRNPKQHLFKDLMVSLSLAKGFHLALRLQAADLAWGQFTQNPSFPASCEHHRVPTAHSRQPASMGPKEYSEISCVSCLMLTASRQNFGFAKMKLCLRKLLSKNKKQREPHKAYVRRQVDSSQWLYPYGR